jgi:ABC-type uncharacterized transport system permease subunit
VFQITNFLLYLLAAVAFAMNRLPRHTAKSQLYLGAAVVFAAAALVMHGQSLGAEILLGDGLSVSISGAVSLIGLQLALLGLIGAMDPMLRGMSAGLLLLAAFASATTAITPAAEPGAALAWQLQAHILISMFAYALLSVGAIVAIYALLQDRRLRTGKLSGANHLFAPLETTEKLLFGVTSTGFAALLLAVVSGFAFVDDLFAQHLVHKTALSLLALALFGILLGGRLFAGWRGKQAVYLYLWGFAMLCLAYFGSRFILEQILGRSWG